MGVARRFGRPIAAMESPLRPPCVRAPSTMISATIDGQHEGESSVDLAGAYLEYRYMHRSLKNTDTTQSAGAGQGKQLMIADHGGP
jgi:hypothetical protein